MHLIFDVSGERLPLRKLQRLRAWKTGLHRPLGDLLKLQHERRIETEKTDPSGQPWAPLKEATIARKAARGNSAPDNILIDTRAMAGSFMVSTSGDLIRLRNPATYGIRHQDGTEFMVARPFMGISNPNLGEIARLVRGHIARILSRT